ncbi:IS630 family transposase [Thioflexithrix psekupsensis]|uniref:IS630 family transposase n=2 Tax=Thioflexithrix psekupsensis TaxID=1570016 RepID=A0A251X6Y0_9GAMM|nr:IS630 family transposase [Thioflexithrix psekupsensis]OUD13559.1 hypothetical protein TPSD3_10245 [Thioflexithrix psekupsensis]
MNKRYEDLEELMSTGEAREVKRAMAVRMSLLGFVRAEAALACCVSVQFVDKWKAIYLASGVEGLKLAYKGSPGYLKPREREDVINWIQEKKTITIEELKRYLKEEYDVFYSSNTSYTKLLEEANLSYKKTHKENSAKDEVKVEAKKKEIKDLIDKEREQIESGEVMYWMQDESHQLWGDICGYIWSKKGERTSIKMSNYRTSQTWYGAVNIYTGEFILDRAKKADTKYTIDFINWLIYRYKEARHVIIWDGASYHRSEGLRTYLEKLNGGLPESEWKVRLLRFAPNAPEQNPVEDIWLQGKNWVRKNFHRLSSFKEVTSMFETFLSGKVFKFNKIKQYLIPNI